jgi:hypothetical protein
MGPAPAFAIDDRGDLLVATARDYCAGCGTTRQFELLLAETRVPPDAWGNDDASTIIDAAQWLALSDRLLSSNVARARDAVAEVLKFIPPGAQEPPRSAFFTAAGRKDYVSDPSRFRRDRLVMAMEAYDDLRVRNGNLRKQ